MTGLEWAIVLFRGKILRYYVCTREAPLHGIQT